MTVWEIAFVYALGAFGYGGVELLWRGHTHWTMLLLGGVCFLVIYAVTAWGRGPLWKRCLLCAGAVTALEFGAGCILNLYLGWDVWDYGGVPGNLLGQVCPLYTAFWYLLSLPCAVLARVLRAGFHIRRNAEKPVDK